MIKGKYILLTILMFACLVSISLFLIRCKSSSKDETAVISSEKQSGEVKAQMQSENAAPDFVLTAIDGSLLKLSDFKGKVVILNFWATWCPPCISEIPSMVALQEKHGKDNFTFIGLAVSDEQESVQKFVVANKVNYPIAMSTPEIIAGYGGFNAIPTTFIISKDGYIVKSIVGERSKNEFEDIIKEMLEM